MIEAGNRTDVWRGSVLECVQRQLPPSPASLRRGAAKPSGPRDAPRGFNLRWAQMNPDGTGRRHRVRPSHESQCTSRTGVPAARRYWAFSASLRLCGRIRFSGLAGVQQRRRNGSHDRNGPVPHVVSVAPWLQTTDHRTPAVEPGCGLGPAAETEALRKALLNQMLSLQI